MIQSGEIKIRVASLTLNLPVWFSNYTLLVFFLLDKCDSLESSSVLCVYCYDSINTCYGNQFLVTIRYEEVYGP